MVAQYLCLKAFHFKSLRPCLVIVTEQVQRAMHGEMVKMIGKGLALRHSFLATNAAGYDDIAKRHRRGQGSPVGRSWVPAVRT